MKRILLIFALFAALAIQASAQTIYVGGTMANNKIKVKSSKGETHVFIGNALAALGANENGVYTLVRTEDVKCNVFYRKPRTSDMSGWSPNLGTKFNDDVNNPQGIRDGWGKYVLYQNDDLYQRFDKDDDEYEAVISSIAMRVMYGHVVVAGTYAKRWNKKELWYWGRQWACVDKEYIVCPPWSRMSLKRKYFKGFEEPTRSLENVGFPEYDTDGTWSSVMHVNAVDYMDGDVFTAGWAEREYTYYHVPTAQNWYYVRRCARCWKNGEEYYKQEDNKTSAAYTLTIGGTHKYPIFYTAGHMRGKPSGWQQHKESYRIGYVDGAVSSEAVTTVNNSIVRFFVIGNTLRYNYLDDLRYIKCPDGGKWIEVMENDDEVFALYLEADGSSFSVVKIDTIHDMELIETSFHKEPVDGIVRDWHLAAF